MYFLKLLLVLLLSDFAYIYCTKYTIRPRNDNVKLAKYHKKIIEGDKDSKKDHNPAESTFADEESFGSFAEDESGTDDDNYFMYHHKPEKDHYGFGYRRGNDHHYQERHEKAHPQFGEFQTKVKWGDIHGGHGEHHWDYNHDGGHIDDDTGAHNDGEVDEISDTTQLNEEVDETVKDEERAEINKPVVRNGLVFNVETGLIIDKITGQKYKLHPVP